jgi:hypothetical protein
VAVDETVQFGALQMTPRVCFTRPPTESPNTTSFVEVDEVTLDSKYRRIFTGWMFAASPGLHGIEHAVYDIWLVDCKGGTEVIAEPKETPEELPPIQQDTAGTPGGSARPGSIIAPTSDAPPARTAPRPPAVETAPLRQPVQPTQPRRPAAPIINTDR